MFTSQTNAGWAASVPYVVTNSANAVYAGTGFSNGSSVAGIVGYEADRSWSTYPLPSNQSYTLLSRSPYTDINGLSDYSNAVLYQAWSGAWVFATGTMGWNYGRARPGSLNPGIQQTTAKVLNLFITNVPSAITPTPTLTPTATATLLPTAIPAPSAYRGAVQADHLEPCLATPIRRCRSTARASTSRYLTTRPSTPRPSR